MFVPTNPSSAIHIDDEGGSGELLLSLMSLSMNRLFSNPPEKLSSAFLDFQAVCLVHVQREGSQDVKISYWSIVS